MTAVSSYRNPPAPLLAETDIASWIALLECWLVAGAVVLLAFPAARGVDAWFGWLPFWLVGAPALDLVVLRHRRIAAWLRERLSRLRAHRRAAHRQTRPAKWRARRGSSRPSRRASGTVIAAT
jgi:hypothetical protein